MIGPVVWPPILDRQTHTHTQNLYYIDIDVCMTECTMFATILKFLVFATCQLTVFILSFNSTGSRYIFTFEELLADFYTLI